MNRKIIFTAAAAVLACTILILAFGRRPVSRRFYGSTDGKIPVVASFYPLYFFAAQIGGAKAAVYNLTPGGAEPHDYEPSTGDIIRLEKSRLVIINGGNLEPWAQKIVPDLESSGATVVVAGRGLYTREIAENGAKSVDPHVWIDPVLAKVEVERITKAFEQIDPQNSDFYGNRGRELSAKLDSLNREFAEALKNCAQGDIVTSHAAFGYLAARYGFNQISVAGLSPDSEPSPQKLAEVVKLVRDKNIRYIFFETLVSPRISQTIATETGAKTVAFNPLEGLTKDQESQGLDYFSLQRENLANLRLALECR